MNKPKNIDTPDILRDQLLALAAATRPVHPLPSAESLLWKAEIRRRLAEETRHEEKAIRPALWGQTAGLLIAAGAGGLSILLLSLRLAGSLSGVGALHLPQAVWLAPLAAVPVAAFWAFWMMRGLRS